MLENQLVIHNTRIARIVEIRGGWSSIQYRNESPRGFAGDTVKVRNGSLTAASAKDIETGPAKKMTTKPAAPAAIPAHFVGEITPNKPAKIKDTHFDLSRYFVSDVRTPAGRRTLDCADDISVELRGLSITEVYAKASEVLGLSVEDLTSQYEHLNIGMQRMNLGNRIRGAIAKAARQTAKEAK